MCPPLPRGGSGCGPCRIVGSSHCVAVVICLPSSVAGSLVFAVAVLCLPLPFALRFPLPFAFRLLLPSALRSPRRPPGSEFGQTARERRVAQNGLGGAGAGAGDIIRGSIFPHPSAAPCGRGRGRGKGCGPQPISETPSCSALSRRSC